MSSVFDAYTAHAGHLCGCHRSLFARVGAERQQRHEQRERGRQPLLHRVGRGLCRRGWRGRYWGPRRVWIAPRRVWIAPRVIIRPAPRVIIRGGYNAHIRWCMNRYGSYNPNTDTFLSYDGYYKRCVSPY